jgi:hypothetical protein
MFSAESVDSCIFYGKKEVRGTKFMIIDENENEGWD